LEQVWNINIIEYTSFYLAHFRQFWHNLQ